MWGGTRGSHIFYLANPPPVILRLRFNVSSIPLKDHEAKLLDDTGDMDDASEKTTPTKASKSPQRKSKRAKTVPFKVTLLDASEYESGIEVHVFSLLGFICLYI